MLFCQLQTIFLPRITYGRTQTLAYSLDIGYSVELKAHVITINSKNVDVEQAVSSAIHCDAAHVINLYCFCFIAVRRRTTAGDVVQYSEIHQ